VRRLARSSTFGPDRRARARHWPAVAGRPRGGALARGMSTVRLDTHEALTEAIRLYETPGYHQIPAYGENPHAGLWFEKQLKAP
jgi:hypothetical protein